MAKTAFPMTRSQFLAAAPALSVAVEGNTLVASGRTFSSGSLGWFLSGKTAVLVGGKPVTCQVTIQIVGIGSKEALDDASAEDVAAPAEAPAAKADPTAAAKAIAAKRAAK